MAGKVSGESKGDAKPKVHPPRTAETRRQEKLEKRRKKQLLRQQQQEKAKAEAKELGVDKTGESTNGNEAKKTEKKKKRKRSESKNDDGENSTEEVDGDDKANDESTGKNKKKKYSTFRAFVGQLPFHATEEKIKEHFAKHGCGDVVVRLLRKKSNPTKSRGIAFVDAEDASQLVRLLRAHHTRLDGKMINVERTCGGGGNSEARKEKLKELKELQGSKVLEEVKELVKEAANDSKGNFSEGDIDDRALETLCSFPRDITKKMLTEYKDLDFEKVNNKSAWFMGMIKRYREKLKDGDNFVTDPEHPDQGNGNARGNFVPRGRGGFSQRGGRGGGRGRGRGTPAKMPIGGFGGGRGGLTVRSDRLGANRGRGYAQKKYAMP